MWCLPHLHRPMHRLAMVLKVGGGHVGEPAVRVEGEAEHVAQENVATATSPPDADGLPDRRGVLPHVVIVTLAKEQVHGSGPAMFWSAIGDAAGRWLAWCCWQPGKEEEGALEASYAMVTAVGTTRIPPYSYAKFRVRYALFCICSHVGMLS